jgi:hypothetical protein
VNKALLPTPSNGWCRNRFFTEFFFAERRANRLASTLMLSIALMIYRFLMDICISLFSPFLMHLLWLGAFYLCRG